MGPPGLRAPELCPRNTQRRELATLVSPLGADFRHVRRGFLPSGCLTMDNHRRTLKKGLRDLRICRKCTQLPGRLYYLFKLGRSLEFPSAPPHPTPPRLKGEIVLTALCVSNSSLAFDAPLFFSKPLSSPVASHGPPRAGRVAAWESLLSLSEDTARGHLPPAATSCGLFSPRRHQLPADSAVLPISIPGSWVGGAEGRSLVAWPHCKLVTELSLSSPSPESSLLLAFLVPYFGEGTYSQKPL